MNDDIPKTVRIEEESIRDVLVDCPDIGHCLRPVRECFSCRHFSRLVERDPENRKGREFYKIHMIGCKYPIARSLFKVMKQAESNDGTD